MLATAQGLVLQPALVGSGELAGFGVARSLISPAQSHPGWPDWLPGRSRLQPLPVAEPSGVARVIELGSSRRSDSRAARIARPLPRLSSTTIRWRPEG